MDMIWWWWWWWKPRQGICCDLRFFSLLLVKMTSFASALFNSKWLHRLLETLSLEGKSTSEGFKSVISCTYTWNSSNAEFVNRMCNLLNLHFEIKIIKKTFINVILTSLCSVQCSFMSYLMTEVNNYMYSLRKHTKFRQWPHHLFEVWFFTVFYVCFSTCI